MAISFKDAHFPQEILLTYVRWYVAYPLSTRNLEEMMAERGISVDHSTVNRWVIKYSPQLEAEFHRRQHPVWVSWRLEEPSLRLKGEWKYLYRAVDKFGKTIDFLPISSMPWPPKVSVSGAQIAFIQNLRRNP